MKTGINLLWLFLLVWTVSADSDAGVLDVCGALHHIDDLNGKIVRIRGEYLLGTEVVGLFGQCDGKVLIGGDPWPPVISTRTAGAALAEANISDWDPGSLGQLPKAFKSKCPSCKMMVTLTSRLKSSRENASYSGRDGKTYHMGFGHLGALGAELDMLAATAIVIEP